MHIIIDGLTVEIQKKKVKNINLAVLPPDGRVRISAPRRVSEEYIVNFVRSKMDWIQKQRDKILKKAIIVNREYVTGEKIYLFGEEYTLQTLPATGKARVTINGNTAYLETKNGSTAADREKTVNEWYRRLLKEQIRKYLPKWEKITGLHPTEWQIKNMKTRWGTCNTVSGKIWLNLQLAKKPFVCLEYVILHELTHLRIRNHGKDFIEAMNRYMPEWQAIKEKMNEF